VQQLFYPQSLVIVGVSDEPNNLGRNIVGNLDRFSFKGDVYLVGTKQGRLGGRPIYAGIEDVPGNPDLAVILIPARGVPDILDCCGRKGIRRAVIESGGFREYSQSGEEIERELIKIAQHHSIRFVGPNCIGIMNLDNNLVTPFPAYDPSYTRKGSISLISQSGGVIVSLLQLFSCENLGFNKFVSMGNKLDLDENDYLEYLIQDPGTAIIGLYLESISNGRRLMQLATSTDKPIIMLKANTARSTEDIAYFHTSALAGNDEVCKAALAQCGIHRVDTLNELLDHFKVFLLPRMTGPNVAVVGRSGGQGVMAADAASKYGLMLPRLSDSLFDLVRREARTAVIRLTNPLDLGDVYDPGFQLEVVEAALKEDYIHGIYVHQSTTGIFKTSSEATYRFIHRVKRLSEQYGKPIVLSLFANRDEYPSLTMAADFPLFAEAERAFRVLASSLRHVTRKNRSEFVSTSGLGVARGYESARLERPQEVFSTLTNWGVRVIDFEIVTSLDDALRGAEQLGYPIVLKCASEEVVHKTDVGGVRLDIKGARELESAFKDISRRIGAMVSGAEREFIVQRMAPPGVEVLLGGRWDTEFGPVLSFGLGGIFVEVLRASSLRVAPVAEDEAIELINETMGHDLLMGFRGQPPADVKALCQTISSFSKMLVDSPEIQEVEINPLLVLREGHGCLAIDARMKRVTCVKGPQDVA
jgi:acetyltransferase